MTHQYMPKIFHDPPTKSLHHPSYIHNVRSLKANKISLNVGKTELVLFSSSKKQIDCNLKIRLRGKRLYETDSVKYLGIQIDERLSWKQQINHVAVKLNKANAICCQN